jgi:hypothetical protein
MNLGFIKNETLNALHKLRHRQVFDLTPSEASQLEELRTKGWTTISSEWTNQETLSDLRSRIKEVLKTNQEALWKDQQGADRRLFGIESYLEGVDHFHTKTSARKILSAYQGLKENMRVTMAGHIRSIEDNKGSGGGWHRDTADYNQVKSIMYLTDVAEENGPFQYIEKTHLRSNYERVSRLINKPWYERRFSEKEVKQVLSALDFTVSTITAKAGSILLVDTSGIHRGMPIKQGERMALTSYIWHEREVPEHIEKLIQKR